MIVLKTKIIIKDFLPSEVTDAFGINDKTVEIKNDCANGGMHGGGVWNGQDQ